MRELTDSIYAEPEGLLACVSRSGDRYRSFHDQQGLERLIYSRRAQAEDTQPLEDLLSVLIRFNREARWAQTHRRYTRDR